MVLEVNLGAKYTLMHPHHHEFELDFESENSFLDMTSEISVKKN